jgi:hypothetical protein
MAGEIIPAIRDNAHLLPWLPSSSTPRAVKHLSPAERQREFDEAVDHAVSSLTLSLMLFDISQIPRSGPLALLLVCMLVADKRDVPEDGCDGLGALICDSLKSYGDHFLALYRIEDSATLAAAVDDLVATAVAELDEGLRPTCWLDRDVVHVWAFNRWYIKGSLAPSDPLYLPYLDLMDAILHVLVGLPFEVRSYVPLCVDRAERRHRPGSPGS